MKNGFITAMYVLVFIAICISIVFFTYFEFPKGDITRSSIGTSIDLLQLYIVVFTIGISMLGFLGYKNIKNAAIESVEKQVVEKVIEPKIAMAHADIDKKIRDFKESLDVEFTKRKITGVKNLKKR